ncbi:methyltransferase [Methanosarcina sp. 2.H.T.1A.6]|uniref:class I SAM-dependent methyltransferase n=1 Tax=unclassified Methanosarcina TaxID=2644672 RepID=UPI000621A47D|nr:MULTISPECIES: class I SAM-dependent methyltransferase [unclassified Methanosarcina]KKG14509.1 methyltransferase [Methanosarcina sp. 2.H.T.1A.3]KKG18285.1 methyltransferase [Methanosarcina sp. 2.H.T.1A.15]KKG24239.1 methyltransferase [Methanosarcina sp. 2.H.T.1A.8]KKG24948.1 methyltransferase [Methanosarcina sp. 2.H.T.1A.6]
MTEQGKSPGFPYIAEHIFAPIYPVIAANIIKESGIKQGTCLDLGCGIASLGIAVAEITDMQVYGVDFSTEMCRFSKDKAHRHCLSGKVVPVQADVHLLPFRDNCADLIVSRGSVFFWKDLSVAFTEISRILSPGGQAWIGGGFGTKELKAQISEKMVEIDPDWHIASKKRLSPENLQAMQEAGRLIDIPCRVIQDDSGFWMILSKGG